MTEQAYRSTFKHLSDLKEAVGKEIGLSEWHEVTQEEVNTFAKVTHDEQWIHTDPEKAKQFSPYGTTVAHGFYVLSLASKFCFDLLKIEDVKMVINYGSDRVRFPNATRVGGHLRTRISILSFEEKPGGARYKLGLTFELQGQEKPACVAEWLVQCYV